MDSQDAINAGKAYTRLGWAVQEQLDELMSLGGENAEINRNAVTLINDYARDLQRYGATEAADEIMLEVDAWLRANGYQAGPR